MEGFVTRQHRRGAALLILDPTTQRSLFSLGESVSSPEHQRLAASFRRNEPPLVASADWTCGLLACGS